MKWKKLKRRFRFNKKRHFSYLFLFLILGSMSFGYSMLNSSTWDVYFDNVIINEDSVEAVVEPVISNKTNISFSVKLDNPGDI